MKKYIFKIIDEYFTRAVKNNIENTFLNYDIEIIFEENKVNDKIYFEIYSKFCSDYPKEEIKLYLGRFSKENSVRLVNDSEFYKYLRERFAYKIDKIEKWEE